MWARGLQGPGPGPQPAPGLDRGTADEKLIYQRAGPGRQMRDAFSTG